MKVFFRVINLLFKPCELARFIIVLYRLKESRIKIYNYQRACLYQLSCSRYAYRMLRKHNFLYGAYLSCQRYYCCTPSRFNEKINIDTNRKKNLIEIIRRKI